MQVVVVKHIYVFGKAVGRTIVSKEYLQKVLGKNDAASVEQRVKKGVLLKYVDDILTSSVKSSGRRPMQIASEIGGGVAIRFKQRK